MYLWNIVTKSYTCILNSSLSVENCTFLTDSERNLVSPHQKKNPISMLNNNNKTVTVDKGTLKASEFVGRSDMNIYGNIFFTFMNKWDVRWLFDIQCLNIIFEKKHLSDLYCMHVLTILKLFGLTYGLNIYLNSIKQIKS